MRVALDGVICYDNNSFDKQMKLWDGEYIMVGIPPVGDRSIGFRSDKPADRESESPIWAKTDADGKFELNGVGAEQLAGLTFRGSGAAVTRVSVVNRTGFDPKPYLEAASRSATRFLRGGQYSQWSGPEPQVVIEPEKIIRGTVTARDTGKPLAGVAIEVRTNEPLPYSPMTYEAVTNEEGKYEVRGVRKLKAYSVDWQPDAKTGYLRRQIEVDDTTGYEPITIDLQCIKGVVVTGTMKDKATGQPVAARIWTEQLPDNPFAKKYAAHDVGTDVMPDGTFRFVTIPGPVLVVARTDTDVGRQVYRRLKPDPKFPGRLPKHASDENWCKVIEATESDREVKLEVELEPAPADGGEGHRRRRQAGFRRRRHRRHPPGTRQPGTSSEYGHADSSLTWSPREERFMAVGHVERRLVGTIFVKEGDKDPVVKLGPGGTVTGRVVDGDGKPVRGLIVNLAYYTHFELSRASGPFNPDHCRFEMSGGAMSSPT